MNKIIFVGLLDKVARNGETMKNHLFVERFKEIYSKVYVFDAMGVKHRPWKIFKLIFLILLHPRCDIMLSASPGIGEPLVKVMWILGKTRIAYWMVGGTFHDKINAGQLSEEFYKKLYRIIVQNERMKESLINNGFSNVFYVPNSKRIDYLPNITTRNNSVLKFVFLSRIHPTKGCGEIINSAKFLNHLGYGEKFEIDFYGSIDNCYLEFPELIKDIPNVSYKGFLDLTRSTGYDTLSKYDMMLFPTYWDGEGFPGVIIDSYIAGVPVLASDWNLNCDYVNKQTGIIIPHHNQQRLIEEMKNVIDDRYDLKEMSVNCQSLAMNYDNRNVISHSVLAKIGLI